MGFLQQTFQRLGFVKSTDAWDTFLSMAKGNIGAKGYRLTNQRQFLRAYVDWVYVAASQIAQEASTIDFQAYANRSKKSSKKLARQLAAHPEQVRAMTKDSGTGPALDELDNHILLDLL